MIDASHLAELTDRLATIERRLAEPGTVADRKVFRELMSEHAAVRRRVEKAQTFLRLQKDVDEHRALSKDETGDPELRDLASQELPALEIAAQQAHAELLEALLPQDPAEARSAIMEIRAGTGGDEASLFAADLFRMYSKYAENRGWKISMIDVHPSTVGGFKEVVFSIEGPCAYRDFQYESGVHRVQRIPETEASGRIHTSTATVAVFPEADDSDDIQVRPEDVRIDIFCSSGPGGQGVNTTYSAVRVTHLPTGVVAQSQDERSQHRNRERALSVLKARLLDLRRQEEEDRLGVTRRSQIGSGDRSEKIRTYNFPQNRLTDHRINLTQYCLDRIIVGGLQTLVSALQKHDLDERIRKELGGAAGRSAKP